MPRYQRIPTGRTWRDLPPSPPATFVPAPVFEDDEPTAEPRARLNVWPFVLGGLLVVFLGFLVGLFLPREGIADEQGLGVPDSQSGTTLPDVIIPPAPELPDESEPTLPDMVPAPSVDKIFEIPTTPPGWEIVSDFTQSSSDRIDQMVVLSNGLEELRVSAFAAAAEPFLPNGEDVSVRKQDGVVVREVDGRFLLKWIEPGKVTFSIDAPEAFGLAAAISLAESLEISG